MSYHRTRTLIEPTTTSDEWRNGAVCRLHPDPDLWFPEGKKPKRQTGERRAVALCQTCPVLDTCREWTAQARPEYGVWAALTEDDRRKGVPA